MYTCQILRKLNEDIVPQVCEFHTNTDLAALRFYSWVEVMFTTVAERRLQWSTNNCNGIPGHCKWDVLDEIWLCPLLSLSRPTGSVKRTLARQFFVCSLIHPKTDGSDQMNLPVLQWWRKRFWGHKLKSICLHLVWWVPCLEFDIDFEKY